MRRSLTYGSARASGCNSPGLLDRYIHNPALYERPRQQDEGYIALGNMQNNVIAPMKAQYGSQFGGVVGWEFWQDGPPTYGSAGAWAKGISQAVGPQGSPA